MGQYLSQPSTEKASKGERASRFEGLRCAPALPAQRPSKSVRIRSAASDTLGSAGVQAGGVEQRRPLDHRSSCLRLSACRSLRKAMPTRSHMGCQPCRGGVCPW